MKDLLQRNIIKHKRPIKYLIAGGTAASVDLSLLYIFTDVLGIWYLISACLAFVAAFFVSFFLQKFWTFRDADKEIMYKQMGAYLTVALANLVLNAVLMFIFVDGFKVWYMLAQVMASGLIACESYFVYKVLIFNSPARRGGGDGKGEPGDGKIRILIATGIYPPDIGGPATYAENLSRELKKLNCEVKVIVFRWATESGPEENIFYISRDSNILARYFQFFRMVFRLADWADIIYTLDLMSAGLPAISAAALKRKKVIFRTGGDWLWEKACQSGRTDLPLALYYKERKVWLEKLLMLFCRLLLSGVKMVIFSTEFQAKIYRDFYKLPAAKIKSVANALPKVEAILPDGRYSDRIIFAGRLVKLKNLNRLIMVLSGIDNFKLVIFGQGPEKKNLQDLINKLDLGARIEIKDKVAHDKLISLIGGCRFFILPSITEISPNLALECLSLRKPIILTKETGLEEELTGRLIKLDPMSEADIRNKIVYLLNDKNLADYAVSLGRLEVKAREWSRVAGEHLAIFKEVYEQ